MKGVCRVHHTPLQMDLNGVEFCRFCRHDRDALNEQVSADAIESRDPVEANDALNTLLEAQR